MPLSYGRCEDEPTSPRLSSPFQRTLWLIPRNFDTLSPDGKSLSRELSVKRIWSHLGHSCAYVLHPACRPLFRASDCTFAILNRSYVAVFAKFATVFS
jgi:hypothetical protein